MSRQKSDADRVRSLLERAGLSQRGAARELDIDERTMRRYCAGDPVPRTVWYALLWLSVRDQLAGRNYELARHHGVWPPDD